MRRTKQLVIGGLAVFGALALVLWITAMINGGCDVTQLVKLEAPSGDAVAEHMVCVSGESARYTLSMERRAPGVARTRQVAPLLELTPSQMAALPAGLPAIEIEWRNNEELIVIYPRPLQPAQDGELAGKRITIRYD